MDFSRRAAIRARAYQLWLESGHADGYQDQHWQQAEREIAGQSPRCEDGEGAATSPGKRTQGEAGRHSDGMSRHPSVLDPAPGR